MANTFGRPGLGDTFYMFEDDYRITTDHQKRHDCELILPHLKIILQISIIWGLCDIPIISYF